MSCADLPAFASRTVKPRSSNNCRVTRSISTSVLDQQDRLTVAATRLGWGFDRQGGSDFVCGAGQLDFEGRAAMGLAMDPDAHACRVARSRTRQRGPGRCPCLPPWG